MIVYTTMRYYDGAKVILQIEQPFVNSIAMMSKRWLKSLPPDLKKAVLEPRTRCPRTSIPTSRIFG